MEGLAAASLQLGQGPFAFYPKPDFAPPSQRQTYVMYTATPTPYPHLRVAQDTEELLLSQGRLPHWDTGLAQTLGDRAELARGLERLDHSQTFPLHAQPCPLGIKDSGQSLGQLLALPEHN